MSNDRCAGVGQQIHVGFTRRKSATSFSLASLGMCERSEDEPRVGGLTREKRVLQLGGYDGQPLEGENDRGICAHVRVALTSPTRPVTVTGSHRDPRDSAADCS